MTTELILKKSEEVKTRFNELSEQKNALEQELYRLQGEYRLLESLKHEVTKDVAKGKK